MKFKDQETKAIASTIYHALTTLTGQKTLGEEYCHLLQVDTRQHSLPPIFKRFLYIVLHSIIPVLFIRHSKLTNLQKSIETLIIPLNVVAFYYSGKYYEMAKRILGFRYVYHPRSAPTAPSSDLMQKVLGAALMIVTIIKTWSMIKDQVGKKVMDETEDCPEEKICSLCLGRRLSSSLTPCGHLFCWNCICEWLAQRPVACILFSTLICIGMPIMQKTD